MKIQTDEKSSLSIDDNSFGLLSAKVRQVNAMNRFKNAHLEEFDRLTSREKEILKLLAEGNKNPDIAVLLGITRRTVENHRKHINRKLQIRHMKDIIIYALAFDLIAV